MGVRRELKGWGGDLVGEVLASCAGSPGFNSSEPHTLKVVAQACNLSSQESDKQDKVSFSVHIWSLRSAWLTWDMPTSP